MTVNEYSFFKKRLPLVAYWFEIMKNTEGVLILNKNISIYVYIFLI